MMHSIWTAATGMQAQQMRIDAIANNLANVNTTSYKKGTVEFQDLLYQQIQNPGIETAGVQIGLGVQPVAITKYHAQGNLQITNNALDMAIDGAGFFRVIANDAAGSSAYTRDGSFKVDADGNIVTSTGERLDPPIQIGEGVTDIKIRENGAIFARLPGATVQTQIGQSIVLFTFANPAGLQSIGNNLYRETIASGIPNQGQPGSPAGHGVIRQGALETSNVELVTEMVMMIATQKSYDTAAKAIQVSDRMMESTNQLVR
ncbi:MAG: flagellar basal-body rod protein FlgG [Candidatus Sericytochromatia bacterium]|uniref:Flagellar basal-body rod protein FlgG n=1 Tax=Candidatus Tanganyikabacteria bacterium TaxID=2961651 RepID=A0A937X482_9BACT|nr:flagellar basal-body rod protein FlgG [Candidatus Tanganyikabacteria bacterium]